MSTVLCVLKYLKIKLNDHSVRQTIGFVSCHVSVFTFMQDVQWHKQKKYHNEHNQNHDGGKNPVAWLWWERIWNIVSSNMLPPCGRSWNCTVIPHLTFNSQDEALLNSHSQGLMGDTARKAFPWVTERSCEVEEGCQWVGPVRDLFVARPQRVRDPVGKERACPLAWNCWVLLVPNYVNIQRVITLRLTCNLLSLTHLQGQTRINIEGDTGSLWGEKRKMICHYFDVSCSHICISDRGSTIHWMCNAVIIHGLTAQHLKMCHVSCQYLFHKIQWNLSVIKSIICLLAKTLIHPSII